MPGLFRFRGVTYALGLKTTTLRAPTSSGAGKFLLILAATSAIAGCTNTTIIDSENPSKQRPPAWTDYWTLPVAFNGAVPGQKLSDLSAFFPTTAGPGTATARRAGSAAGSARRIVMYINPAARLDAEGLCVGTAGFRPGVQEGRYARLTASLCDGGTVVTWATSTMLTAGLTASQVAGHLETMRLQLYQALTLGNNHPEQVHPSQMYGP